MSCVLYAPIRDILFIFDAWQLCALTDDNGLTAPCI